jgi:hypothetical protein
MIELITVLQGEPLAVIVDNDLVCGIYTYGARLWNSETGVYVGHVNLSGTTCGVLNKAGLYLGTTTQGIYFKPRAQITGQMTLTDQVTTPVLQSSSIIAMATRGEDLLICSDVGADYIADATNFPRGVRSCVLANITHCCVGKDYIAIASNGSVFFSQIPTTNWMASYMTPVGTKLTPGVIELTRLENDPSLQDNLGIADLTKTWISANDERVVISAAPAEFTTTITSPRVYKRLGPQLALEHPSCGQYLATSGVTCTFWLDGIDDSFWYISDNNQSNELAIRENNLVRVNTSYKYMYTFRKFWYFPSTGFCVIHYRLSNVTRMWTNFPNSTTNVAVPASGGNFNRDLLYVTEDRIVGAYFTQGFLYHGSWDGVTSNYLYDGAIDTGLTSVSHLHLQGDIAYVQSSEIVGTRMYSLSSLQLIGDLAISPYVQAVGVAPLYLDGYFVSVREGAGAGPSLYTVSPDGLTFTHVATLDPETLTADFTPIHIAKSGEYFFVVYSGSTQVGVFHLGEVVTPTVFTDIVSMAAGEECFVGVTGEGAYCMGVDNLTPELFYIPDQASLNDIAVSKLANRTSGQLLFGTANQQGLIDLASPEVAP